LIIEQILLLLMRCALVVLVAVLLAGLSCNPRGIGGPKQSSAHFVVVDDTLSLQDVGQDPTGTRSAFDEAKRLVKEIARKAPGRPGQGHRRGKPPRPRPPAVRRPPQRRVDRPPGKAARRVEMLRPARRTAEGGQGGAGLLRREQAGDPPPPF